MIKRRESGFSLLEIIIVMAIAGGLLTMYTRYVRKQADRSSQHAISAALVQEMKGVINFVRDRDMAVKSEESNTVEEVPNPLYNTETPDADYQVRLSNDINDVDTGNKSEYYLWGDGSDASQQQRYRFISSSCKATLKSEYAFEKEYLPCWMSGAAKNNAAHIERVGFRGSELESQSGSINQIDAIVEFSADTRDDLLAFARFQPALAQAFSDAGDVPSHAWIVHRDSSSADWQLVTKNNDGKTPVEFGAVASSIGSLNSYTSGEFGVRFTFDLNDNDSDTAASGGGGDMCWNSEDSQVEMCYEQRTGTGTHGENTVLALNMKDANNTNGDQKLGTLQTNVVMENTARKVYIFKRDSWGKPIIGTDGNPVLYQYKDPHSQLFTGEYYMDDINMFMQNSDSSTYSEQIDYYNSETYDGFELVTPAIIDYVSHYRQHGQSLSESPDGRPPSYEDSATSDDQDNDYNNVRYPVQTCPQVEQDIVLRNAGGSIQTEPDGKPKTVKVVRRLFPRLSVAISSISAYPAVNQPKYTDPSQNRNALNTSNASYNTGELGFVGQLAGITVQTEFAKQDIAMIDAGINQGFHFLYPDSKYIWIISSVLGVYKESDGKGANIINPWSVSYTVSRWCSTIPQPGTPADLLDSYQYQ